MDIRLIIKGMTPLLMHNAQLSDPLNKFTIALKEVTSKRIKTHDDIKEMARREWAGGLYFEPEIGPYIPGQNIERSLLDAARLNKLGKSIERGVFVTTNENPVVYSGSRNIEDLIDDENFRLMASVKIGQQRVMRCRPFFKDWSLEAVLYVDETQLDLPTLKRIVENAGKFVGLGDWRPRYGRYIAVAEEI